MIKDTIRRMLAVRGKVIVLKSDLDNRTADIPEETKSLFAAVEPFTMTSLERVAALVDAVRYVVEARIPGAIVECGVWRGGSMMAAIEALLACGETTRDLYLFDTFEGMPDADATRDVDFLARHATALLSRERAASRVEQLRSPLLAYSPIEEVRANIASTGYPAERTHFVQGRVEDTIPAAAPGSIAVLRLDTDWYESTRHEFLHLFPRVSTGGVVIVDDYGHWKGARDATDEYLSQQDSPYYLHRIDYTGRLLIKR